MYKKEITYTDFDGNEVTETHYFHLNRVEAIRMDLATQGGLENTIRLLTETNDAAKVFKMFEGLVEASYGIREADGKRFSKAGGAHFKAFQETPAYDEFIIEMLENADMANAFVRGIVPAMPEDRKTSKSQSDDNVISGNAE